MPTSPANDEEAQQETQPDAEVPGETAEVDQLRAELDSTRQQYHRALADLDNYRKRMAKEGDRRAAQARDEQLREWLEALDSVERALRMEPEDPGLTAVLDQMETILTRHGITRLAEVGEPFDPTRHEAIAVVPAAEVPDRSILEVTRAGFGTPDGDVLRSAQVVVAKVDDS